MKIILSPAKKMKINRDVLEYRDLPQYIDRASKVMECLKSKKTDELVQIWKCNDKIARQNIERLEQMDLFNGLSPAILCYEGIAYQYMAPVVFEDSHFDYVQEHLRILSGFYGVLRPMDGVTPYRLEMQARISVDNCKDLYDFWGKELYTAVRDDDGIIVNLASKEYSKCISNYLSKGDHFIDIVFCEKSGDKLVTKGTYAKMARGEMVRYMAENSVNTPDDMKSFDRLGYVYRDNLSSNDSYVFERVNDK